jgi:hypothetical protein
LTVPDQEEAAHSKAEDITRATFRANRRRKSRSAKVSAIRRLLVKPDGVRIDAKADRNLFPFWGDGGITRA